MFRLGPCRYESIGGSANGTEVANASNAQGRSSIVQGWDLRSPTGETTKESLRSFVLFLVFDHMLFQYVSRHVHIFGLTIIHTVSDQEL
jgi:hypothetical protein